MAEQGQRTRKQWKLEGHGGFHCLKQYNLNPVPVPGDTGMLVRFKISASSNLVCGRLTLTLQ